MSDDFDFDAYLRLPRLSGLGASPDGQRLVVSVGRPAPDGKKMHSSLWELDASGDERPRRLTRSAPGESAATFARDGSILFTSSRPDPDRGPDDGADDEEISGLWLLPPNGGEARLLAAPSGGVDAVVSARDADVVVYAASVFPGTRDAASDLERHKARKKAGVDALLFETVPIGHWDSYHGPRERHLFAAPMPAGEDRIGDPKDLTPDAGIALTEQGFDVTPDGATIVTGWVTSDEIGRTDFGLMAIDRATGEHRRITPEDSWFDSPACSPDGRWVACVRSDKDVPERVGDATLWLIDLATGDGRDLTPDLDLWPAAPCLVGGRDGHLVHHRSTGRRRRVPPRHRLLDHDPRGRRRQLHRPVGPCRRRAGGTQQFVRGSSPSGSPWRGWREPAPAQLRRARCRCHREAPRTCGARSRRGIGRTGDRVVAGDAARRVRGGAGSARGVRSRRADRQLERVDVALERASAGGEGLRGPDARSRDLHRLRPRLRPARLGPMGRRALHRCHGCRGCRTGAATSSMRSARLSWVVRSAATWRTGWPATPTASGPS